MKVRATRTPGDRPSPWLAVSVALLTLGTAGDPAETGSPCTRVKRRNTFLAESIGLLASPEVPEEVVLQAIALWRTCVSYGEGFPAFEPIPPSSETARTTKEARRVLTVRYRPGTGGGEHCGHFVGTEIVLFDFMTGPDGRQQPCGSLAHNLAHELGHVLGLRDAPPGPACEGQIMSLISERNAGRREVSDEECQAVGQMWLTAWEHRRRRDVLDRLADPAQTSTSPAATLPDPPPPTREKPP